MSKPLPKPVVSLDQAQTQIIRYGDALDRSPELLRRVSFTRSWYALRDGETWRFAPSKFLRRQFERAEDYLAVKGHPDAEPDGDRTEKMLRQWFAVVPPDTRLASEVTVALEAFLAAYGKRRREEDRINVLHDELEQIRPGVLRRADDDRAGRIVSDPAICGGRPTIRGTRVRVTDILEMLASGAARGDILRDFDYLSEKDIGAALGYAAGMIDHRVIRAA
ncbi:DUF433 domain-containing protein [Aurantimonas sp. E1-2-R+4]|uniref:DUF433 domain-containing protein n=1 Tax=Aurantimonas sp. E1-2-R+4 TaxID=3113714 RepID=UPI002F942E4D